MRKINNRQELNHYYDLIHTNLDKYFTEYKVVPEDFVRYVKSNLEDIKEELGVSDVSGIDKVILDVVSHYRNSELDGILKFESFRSRFK